MRRILLSCALFAVLMLSAAAPAGARGHAAPGFVVVRKAAADGGVRGHPVVTLVVEGFVLGRVSPHAEAQVEIYHLPSATGEGAPQAVGPDVSRHNVRWRGHAGTRYSGSGFRFRAIDGAYRVVVRGSGVYLFAGGTGNVTLHGSTSYPRQDGTYALNGNKPLSLPESSRTLQFGRG